MRWDILPPLYLKSLYCISCIFYFSLYISFTFYYILMIYYCVLFCIIVFYCVLLCISLYYYVLLCIILHYCVHIIVFYCVLLCIIVYYCVLLWLLCIIWEDNLIGEQADSSKLPVSVVPTHFKSHSCFRPPVWKLNCISVFSLIDCISVYFSIVFLCISRSYFSMVFLCRLVPTHFKSHSYFLPPQKTQL